MKSILLTLSLLFCLLNCPAQGKKLTDSLEHTIQIADSDTARVAALNRVAFKILQYNPAKSEQYALEALALSEKIRFEPGIAASYWSLSKVYTQQGRYSMSTKYAVQGLKVSEKIKDEKRTMQFLIALTLEHYKQKIYITGLHYAIRGLAFGKQAANRSAWARMNSVAGLGYSYLKKYDSANYYSQKAVQSIRSVNDSQRLSSILFDAGMIQKTQENYRQAQEYFTESIAIAKILHLNAELLNYEAELASVLMRQGEYEKSLGICQDAMTRVDKVNYRFAKFKLYRIMAESCAHTNRPSQAYEYQTKALILKDSILNEETAQKIAELQTLYETEKKEAQITLLTKNEQIHEQELYQRSLMLYGSLTLLSLVGLLAFALFSSNRHKQKTNQLLEKQKQQIEDKNRALEKQKQEIEEKNRVLSQQNEEIESQMEKIESQSSQLHAILEQRNAQNRILQESEVELLKLNSMKNKYFSILSHDMKNSFGSLRMFVPLLEEQLGNLFTDQTRELFSGFKANVKSINNLLDNLLLWSLSQMNMMPMEKKELEIAPLAQENIALFMPSANSKQIILFNETEPGLRVHADPHMLNSILRNLISNAVKFTPEYGTIVVSTRTLDQQIEIRVRDSGIGIDETDQLKLFHLHSNNKTSQATKGTGLGLILCREFAGQMGGSMRVESRSGQGSIFICTLPLLKAQHKVAEYV